MLFFRSQSFSFLIVIFLLLVLIPGVLSAESEIKDQQILDNSGKGEMTTPPILRGPLPSNRQGMPTPAPLQQPEKPATKAAAMKLDTLVEETIQSMGAVFADPEQIVVQPPLLTALITIEERLSPYSLEASGARSVSLFDVLTAAGGQNLNIKIAGSDSDVKRWNMISSFGNFLPTLVNEITYQGLTGQYISPAGAAIPINNWYLNTNSGFTQYLYKGGYILHTYLENKHEYKASKHAVALMTNDSLLETAKDYYQLALNETLLQIRIKATEAGQALLLVNQDMYANGVNTMLEVLQAKTQLSHDRQQLIKQQIQRRQAAVALATVMNENAGTDLSLGNPKISKLRLVDKSLSIKELLQIALDNRPELKRYEELRLAAKEAIKVARAPLLPQISMTGATVGTFARIHDANALSSEQQQTPFATSGGASTGAVSSSSLPLATGSTTSGGRHDAGRSLFVLGVDMQWQLGGLGLTAQAKVEAARYEAHRRQLEFLRELNRVYKEVRDSYLSSLEAENLIVETTDTVNSSKEQLRVAKDRLVNGVGTNIDVINAERDYISALVDKANAIIQFNTAQAQLLRDVGRISISNLVASTPLRQ